MRLPPYRSLFRDCIPTHPTPIVAVYLFPHAFNMSSPQITGKKFLPISSSHFLTHRRLWKVNLLTGPPSLTEPTYPIPFRNILQRGPQTFQMKPIQTIVTLNQDLTVCHEAHPTHLNLGIFIVGSSIFSPLDVNVIPHFKLPPIKNHFFVILAPRRQL
ncbi:hypothetical protein V8G54_025426 [Vigna mungo]|uniref:Uncharacterized protein n=1 Tax=Vigna mungo TaxID=3915 RepID=A0AAQ3RM84_VIGMU